MIKKARAVLPYTLMMASLSLTLPLFASGSGGNAKLHVHGFLTQAYGEASLGDDSEFLSWIDGNVLGLTGSGTTDYRTMALQFRYDMSADSSMVIQLDHERTGEEISLLREDDIKLDWAFFNHRFRNGLSVKVGRIPLAWGIYNEIRDAGTLLPFYRPPDLIYRETGAFDGTMEGLQLSRRFFDDRPWSVELDLFGGQSEWESASLDEQGKRTPVSGRVDRVGLRAWVETPLDGLRVGLSLLDEEFEGGVIQANQTLPSDSWMASIDGNFDRFFVRAEFYRIDSVVEQPAFGRSNFKKDNAYIESGVRLVGGLEVMAQYLEGEDESTLVDDPSNPLVTPEPIRSSTQIDRVLGLRYIFNQGVILRFEYHNRDEFFPRFSQTNISPRPDGRLDLRIPSDSGKADFFVFSLSASF